MAVRVVFVCMGNICRSPMAKAVFRDMLNKAGLDGAITVDSCGTGGWHAGEPAHPGTERVLRDHGIDWRHSARKITLSDLAEADYLIAMDTENLSDIRRLGPTQAEVSLLLSYAPEVGIREVPDPWYDHRFDETYRLIEAGCRGLLAHICEKEGL